MADDNQELSMEDILSSIKDILTEDQAVQKGEPVQPKAVAPEASAAGTLSQQSAAEDDVLDLSPSMRVENEEGINLDDELGGISANIDDIGLEARPADEKPLASPFFSATPAPEEISDLSDNLDLDSDPFYAPETEPGLSALAESDAGEPFEIADLPAEPPVVEADYEPQPQPQAEPELYAEPEPQAEPEFYAEPEPEPQPTQVTAEETPVEKLEVKSDAVDVSASIISNFAKMFTKEKEPEPAAPASKVSAFAGERVHLLGAGSKTIEDVVSDVIRGIIGAEVAENWRQGADYDAFAREVIAAQTRQWLETNLPAVVERIVKEEIARVMEKAGN